VSGAVAHTGDIARDVLVRSIDHAATAQSLTWWPVPSDEPFVFATLHRAELTGDVGALRCVLSALGQLGLPVILPAHPRLRAALTNDSLGALASSIHLFKPLGYFEALACTRDAVAVVTDSGGVQREAYWLGTPCVTVRQETEWVETVELGANVVVPPSAAVTKLPSTVQRWLQAEPSHLRWDRDAYGAGDAATRIRTAIDELASARG
jgi:UDP-N-acetylglucosamine 2-epimerase